MIYVTQGHERSIALEVFIHSFLMLGSKEQQLFTLVANKEALKENLDLLKLKYKFSVNSVSIGKTILNVVFVGGVPKLDSSQLKKENIDQSDLPLSTRSLVKALDLINSESDILLTLPTSKDQLIIDGKQAAGYTEFFRKKFNSDKISMLFSSGRENVLLVTDHIPVNEITDKVTEELIYQKSKVAIENFSKYFTSFDELVFAGINPHAGEQGILGTEDVRVESVITKLRDEYPKQSFIGPVSGDTLHFHRKADKSQLMVYMFHDQGLTSFKEKNGLIGLNITLGLPFLRMSVDHGTAFEWYGQNKAHTLGALYLLQSAINAHTKISR